MVDIGKKLRELRLRKNLTQEELGERTDLTKGYISQLENGLSSPSMETFFDSDYSSQPVVYTASDGTIFEDEEKGFSMNWLMADSNDKEMEAVMLTLKPNGEHKQFPPSLSETFGYVMQGSVELQLGETVYSIKKGQSFYFQAREYHQLRNRSRVPAEVLIVVTNSYL